MVRHIHTLVLKAIVALVLTGKKSAAAFQAPLPNNKSNDVRTDSRSQYESDTNVNNDKQQHAQPNRRSAIQTALQWLSVPAASAVTTFVGGEVSSASAVTEKGSSSDFTVYQVIPDPSEALSPTIKAVKVCAY